MRLRSLVPLAVASMALTACLDTTAPEPLACETVPSQQVSMQGDTVTTSTGLRYIDTKIGTGAAVKSCAEVLVHYTGYLADGTEFDSSEGGQPLYFAPGINVPGLGRMIAGFEQGVIGMQVGGTRRLIIPPALGYGDEDRKDQQGNVIIPKNSTVIFDVELVDALNRE